MLSNSSYSTISTRYFVRYCLISFLQNKDSDSQTLIDLKKYILERTKNHLVDKISKGQNEAMLIAAFLDPKSYSIMGDKELKDVKKLITDKSKTFIPEISQEIAKKVKTDKKSIVYSFASMCGVALDESNGATSSIKNELNEYIIYVSKYTHLSLNEFWRTNCGKFRILAEFVKYYCIIPISSVKSEKSFSSANFYQRKERSSLSAKNHKFSMILPQHEKLKELKLIK
jgi:hypothetical protein